MKIEMTKFRRISDRVDLSFIVRGKCLFNGYSFLRTMNDRFLKKGACLPRKGTRVF